jgi:hypothetical protein
MERHHPPASFDKSKGIEYRNEETEKIRKPKAKIVYTKNKEFVPK